MASAAETTLFFCKEIEHMCEKQGAEMTKGLKDYWHIVIVDGDSMPLGSNFYRRRGALGLGVRGNRQQGNGFAIVTEGIVITKSESLAREFYQIVQDTFEEQLKVHPERKPSVKYGRVVLSDLELSPIDKELHQELTTVLAKRGRRPLPEEWHCGCEECDALWVNVSVRPITCPVCGATKIRFKEA
jgi:hypothetical protein